MLDRDKKLKEAVKDMGLDEETEEEKKASRERAEAIAKEVEKEYGDPPVEKEEAPLDSATVAKKAKRENAYNRLKSVALNKEDEFVSLIAPRIKTVAKLMPLYEELEEEAAQEADDLEREGMNVTFNPTNLDRDTILEVIREADMGLEDHLIRNFVDKASVDDDQRVNYVEALNNIQVHLLNEFGRELITACFNNESGNVRLNSQKFVKIFNEYLKTNLDAREIIELESAFLVKEMVNGELQEAIRFEELISNIVAESIRNLPKPLQFSEEQNSASIVQYIDSLADTLTDTALKAGNNLATSGAPGASNLMERTGVKRVGDLLLKELYYLDEAAEAMGGGTLQEKQRRIEKKKSRLSGAFDRDEYMKRQAALKEENRDSAEEKSSEETDAADSSSSSEQAGEDDVEETKYEGTTAVTVNEEVKTVWEKRLERWTDKVKQWRGYREIKKTQRQLEASNNPIVAATREKIQEAKDMLEDAKEIYETSQDPIIWKMRDLSDSMFGETEQGYVKSEILAIDNGFDEEEFIAELSAYMIPIVLGAFYRSDLEFLRTISSGAAEAALHQAITQRITLGQVMDSDILSISMIDIAKYSLEHGGSSLERLMLLLIYISRRPPNHSQFRVPA